MPPDAAIVYFVSMGITGLLGCFFVEMVDRKSDAMAGFRTKPRMKNKR